MARSILIADDSPVIQRMAQRILEDEGFEVQTVSNGVAAVKKLPMLQPAVVLADVSMPGKDGYEVCEFVKASAGLRDVPVLLVVSDLEPYDEPRGARVRADGIIKKPFTPHDLIAAVRRFAAHVTAPAPPPSETPVAAPLETVQRSSTESQDASENSSEGKREESPSAGLAAGTGDIMSSLGPQSHRRTSDLTDILPEPSAASSRPFPGFVLDPASESGTEPSQESGPEPALAAPETPAGVPADLVEFVLPPQVIDLTAPEEVPEALPAFAAPFPEAVIAPGPELTPAETAQGLGESKTDQLNELDPSPQPVDLTTLETAAQPAPLLTGPTPQPFSAAMPDAVAVGLDKPRESQDFISSAQTVDESAFREAAPGSPLAPTGIVPESNPAAAPEPAAAGPETPQEWGDLLPPALDLPVTPDKDWVQKVVHKVVARMAPPVLSPEQVAELARTLTQEIASELGGPCKQIVDPPQRPSKN